MTHRCYDQALAQNPKLRGSIRLHVTVGAEGRVCSSSVAADTTGDALLAGCVSGFFRVALFSRPVNGCADVTIPITFAGMADAGAPAKP
jgi:hypothetical protein